MADKFKALSVLASKLNKMPIDYTSAAGRVYKTYYTTHDFLSTIYLNIGSDNSIEKDLRTLNDSCLKELGFKQLGTFTNVLTGESIAIFGI